jgi:CheY-like chemotaxis protein
VTGAIRLLIADDHPVVRDGLRAMLATQPDMELVGEAATGTQAVERARALRPDVVLMDLQMPRLDGPGAITALRQRAPEVHVLVLTTFGSDADITRAIDAVKTHLLRIFAKLGVDDRTAAVTVALERGIIRLPDCARRRGFLGRYWVRRAAYPRRCRRGWGDRVPRPTVGGYGLGYRSPASGESGARANW